MPLAAPDVTDSQLEEVERRFRAGLARRSLDELRVLGFGEIGIAIGAPAEHPVAVVKRVPAVTSRSTLDEWFAYIERYERLVSQHVDVAPTEKRALEIDDGSRWVGYTVQPLYPSEMLVENIMASTDPVADHPIVVAVRDAALSAVQDGRAAIDAQFSNFVWQDEALTSIDCGSAFMYGPDGEPDYQIGAYSVAMPLVLKPVVQKLAVKVTRECGTPNGNLELAALSVVRIGQERWLDEVLATFNERLERPIERTDVMKRFDKLHGEMQQIKRIGKIQRAWLEKVRRQRYEFFITDSFTGEVL